MTVNIDALRTRYQPGFRPVCVGCGEIMEAIVYGFFRCRGRVKVGRRFAQCPEPGQWERPTAQATDDVLALLESHAALALVVNKKGHLDSCGHRTWINGFTNQAGQRHDCDLADCDGEGSPCTKRCFVVRQALAQEFSEVQG